MQLEDKLKIKIVDNLMSIIPFENIKAYTLENPTARIEDFIRDAARVSHAEDVILDLIEGIEKSSTNGIGADVWEAYKSALKFVGETEKLKKCLDFEWAEGDHGYSGNFNGRGIFE